MCVSISVCTHKNEILYFSVYRSEHFRVGSNITLQCSNKTWNEMIYTIWKIPTHEKLCQISSTEDGQNMNTCNDGKALCNTTNGESYLCIPEFSERDEGSYFCETVHKGGSYAAKIDVLVTGKTLFTTTGTYYLQFSKQCRESTLWIFSNCFSLSIPIRQQIYIFFQIIFGIFISSNSAPKFPPHGSAMTHRFFF